MVQLKTRITKTLEFISAFVSDHLQKDSVSIHNALKIMAYGQAAISFTLLTDNTEDQSMFMAVFALIFPLFLVLGAYFGILAQQNNKNGSLLVVTIFVFMLLTLSHSAFIAVFLFSFNKAAALAFILSFIAVPNILGYTMRIYSDISKISGSNE
jgi:RsiW-degrading membrane proteinase PrsW (M82 family)